MIFLENLKSITIGNLSSYILFGKVIPVTFKFWSYSTFEILNLFFFLITRSRNFINEDLNFKVKYLARLHNYVRWVRLRGYSQSAQIANFGTRVRFPRR